MLRRMLRIIANAAMASALLVAPLALGCGGNGDDDGARRPSSGIESQLDEERLEALEFWWQQGEGTSAEHLVLASAGLDGAMRLAVFELPLIGAGWQSLFETAPEGVAFSRFELALSRPINDLVHASVAQRIANDLGGRAAFERSVQTRLEAGDGERLDVAILGSALVAVPSALGESDRNSLFDELTLAHAAARRREADSGDAAAYAPTYGEVLATVGWVSSSSGFGPLAPGAPLLASMAPLASAESWLKALGLLEQ